MLGGRPSSSSRFGLGADGRHGAHRVEEVGEQEGEDEQHGGDDADVWNEPNSEKCPTVARSGESMTFSGSFGTMSPQPVGLTLSPATMRPDLGDGLDDDRQHGRGHDGDEDRAPDLADHEHDDEDQPDDEDERRPAAEGAVDAELDRDGAGRRAPHEAGVDEADEGDEQADADADRDLELLGHGVEDRLPEPGEHEHEDDEALEDDEAHRVGPRHL